MAFNKARAVQDAERALAQGKIREATQQYLEIVENDPSDLPLLNLAGDLCVRARNTPEALRLYRRLADAYIYEGHVPRAIAIYKKILKLEPSSVDAMVRLADLYTRQGLAHDARDLYAQALAICQERNLQEKALEVLRRISAAEPANIHHAIRLAELCAAAGKEADAFEAYVAAAELALTGSNPESAGAVIERAAALRPDDPRVRALRQRFAGRISSGERTETAGFEQDDVAAELATEPPPLEPQPEPDLVMDMATPEEPETAGGSATSEIDLSDEWDAQAGKQVPPSAADLDFEDILLELRFYNEYGLREQGLQKLDSLTQQFPGNARLTDLRRSFEEGRLHQDRGGNSGGSSPEEFLETASNGEATGPAASTAIGGGKRDFAASLGAVLSELGSERQSPAGEGDPQTHYELGIAFREMGLINEAIGELQKSIRRMRPGANRERFLAICSLLAMCFVDKRMPSLAAKWYTHALEAPGLDPDIILSLQYDRGLAYELAGDFDGAREDFLEVYAQKMDYRDVAAKIRMLTGNY